MLAVASLLLMSWANARAEAQQLINIEYTAFIWAAIMGWLVFDEALTLTTLAGTALIVAGCIVAARGGKGEGPGLLRRRPKRRSDDPPVKCPGLTIFSLGGALEPGLAMPTPVFLTVDTELVWRHHAAGLALAEIVERSIEPGGVGIGYQLGQMARHGLKGTFFVDPMPALTFGLDVIRRIVDPILAAGPGSAAPPPSQLGARAAPGDGGATLCRFRTHPIYPRPATRPDRGRARIADRGRCAGPGRVPRGQLAANDETLVGAGRTRAILYDSSHNGGEAPVAVAKSACRPTRFHRSAMAALRRCR